MILTILGLLLWSGAHLFKRLAPAQRAALGDRGKGLVALVSVAAIVLMVIGYRGWDWDGDVLWNREAWMTPVNNAGMLLAVYLFAASGMKTRVAVAVRHPQLIAVLIWVATHLLLNGDVPSLVLFGGLGLWALVSLALVSRAGTAPAPVAPAPVGKEIGALVGAVIVTLAVGWAHSWFGLVPFG